MKPTDVQRTHLTALQEATAKAADILKSSCPPDNARTPPARLEAVGARLDAMLQAIATVRPALDTFYNALSDEQRAGFDAIGPERNGARCRHWPPTRAKLRTVITTVIATATASGV